MSLRPVLGSTQLTFYSIGVIIGAGVYSVIGVAAGQAGDGLWLSFLIGAGVALLTALSYAEMTTAFPAAGAEYVYMRKAWPKQKWLSFGVGITILAGGSAAAATVAAAFGGYLRVFFEIPAWVSAIALLAICGVVVTWGLRESSWINIGFTIVEIGGLLLIIAAGASAETTRAPSFAAADVGVLAAAATLFFVYLGFEEIANLA